MILRANHCQQRVNKPPKNCFYSQTHPQIVNRSFFSLRVSREA